MIEGLKLKLTCDELKTHCLARADYHAKRAEEKSVQLPELKRSLDAIKVAGITGIAATTVSTMGKGGYALDTDDPIEKLERDINDHRNKSLVFRFFAEHFFPEDYTLREEDLIRLEILKR